MDYSKLSDQEINMAVAAITHPESTVIESKSRPPCACITGHLPSYWVDYCNNAADAWPIIVGNKISIRPHGRNKWYCHKNTGMTITQRSETSNQMECQHENPLRAAMIVFLKMQESANVPANPAGPDIR
ncbi:phage protein NinX family protein [Kluyvera ascorbata]|uniref:phage protein NinX family protein n=1 Tax=Kluyvera ascorbata TaxID=51288 RepID=UPI0039F68847